MASPRFNASMKAWTTKKDTTPCWTTSPWQRNLNQIASGNPGAVQFWDRLKDNAPAIQALGAILTVLLTVGALVGIKAQIDASAQLQREQSARDIYREFLNLSISRPELSDPDYCKVKEGQQYESYLNYIEYLLYTSEQLIAASKSWEPALEARLEDHQEHFCQADGYWTDYTPDVRNMVSRFRAKECKTPTPACAGELENAPESGNATEE